MPLTLDSTAALRGEQPPPKVTLVVTSHGRWGYLQQTINSTNGLRLHRAIYSFDGCHPFARIETDYPVDILSTGPDRLGLTANLTQAWGALTPDDEYVLHVEEDMVLRDAPVADMARVLDQNRDLAQLALVRQPWSAEEHAAGGLLHGPHLQGDLVDEGGWLRQKRIFTLNPFLAHASLLRTLRPGVEQSLTAQCLERGLSFGYWGSMDDPPRVEHIGVSGGMGSPLWRP